MKKVSSDRGIPVQAASRLTNEEKASEFERMSRCFSLAAWTEAWGSTQRKPPELIEAEELLVECESLGFEFDNSNITLELIKELRKNAVKSRIELQKDALADERDEEDEEEDEELTVNPAAASLTDIPMTGGCGRFRTIWPRRSGAGGESSMGIAPPPRPVPDGGMAHYGTVFAIHRMRTDLPACSSGSLILAVGFRIATGLTKMSSKENVELEVFGLVNKLTSSLTLKQLEDMQTFATREDAMEAAVKIKGAWSLEAARSRGRGNALLSAVIGEDKVDLENPSEIF